jgi:hypothetical protein
VSPLDPSDTHYRSLILAIFTSCGRCRFLDEKHFDACTALAGSGPAFVALVLEAMVDGGVMMGLPRAEALELAAQTLQGTGRMALYAGLHPAQLKDSVTSESARHSKSDWADGETQRLEGARLLGCSPSRTEGSGRQWRGRSRWPRTSE